MTEQETLEDAANFPLAPRGSSLGPAPPKFGFSLNSSRELWTEEVPKLLEEARTADWKVIDLPWKTAKPLSGEFETALCQVLTFLVQNEYLSLYLVSKFVPRISPYFGDVSVLLSYHIRDEARHIDAQTKRVNMGAGFQKVSSATQYALKSVLELEDFPVATFVLYVMGDGTIADLLGFLSSSLPDGFTQQMFQRIAMDEWRHVSYGIARARYLLTKDDDFLSSITKTVEEKASYFFEVAAVDEVVKQSVLKVLTVSSKAARPEFGEAELKRMYSSIDNGRRSRLLELGLDKGTVDGIMDVIGLSGSGLC